MTAFMTLATNMYCFVNVYTVESKMSSPTGECPRPLCLPARHHGASSVVDDTIQTIR